MTGRSAGLCRTPVLFNASDAAALAETAIGRQGLARILVTGAAGFIGRALCRTLAARGHAVVGAVRAVAGPGEGAELVALGEFTGRTDWAPALAGTDIVIHLAQRAHRKGSFAGEPETAAALALAAARAGAGRLVYLSSIKAMGEATAPGRPFRAGDEPRPQDEYGSGKLATEQALATVPGIELTVIRPPLVYGPGVGANFRALMRLVASGLPLPLGGIDNRRSLVFVDNLADLVATAALHPAAARKMLLVRDGVDLSTPALARALASALGIRARLFRLPGIGFSAPALTQSVQIDDAATRALLGWTPPVSAEAGFAATAASFRAARALYR
jgi:nucleoside-diphosphate-sugar epimerase